MFVRKVAFVAASFLFHFFQRGFPSSLLLAFFVQETLVLREGNSKRIPVVRLVVGDVVIVNVGDRVPADIRVISSSGFKVREKATGGITGLTGASLCV